MSAACWAPSTRRPLSWAEPDDEVAPIDGARALAAAMPNAQFLELPPGPHGLMDDELAAAVVNFVRGKPVDDTGERVLSTVLFTDIVSSTEQLVAQGDAQWRHQLDAHDKLVDWLLEKYGGRRVKHTGDGVFALFDGPTKAARCGLDLVPALAAGASASGSGCTPVNASGAATSGAVWRSTSAHGSARWPVPTKCSSAEPSATCRRDRGCASTASVLNTSRGLPRTSKSSA